MLSSQCIFVEYCVETKDKFVLTVPDRAAGTLLPIFQRYILPNTTISSDSWMAYNNIDILDENYIHLTVKHSKNFIDLDTNAYTQDVERMWLEVKSKNVDVHLAEYQWRERNQYTDVFKCILQSCKVNF